MTEERFKDIAPYDDGEEFQQHMREVSENPAFGSIVSQVFPEGTDPEKVKELLRSFTSKDGFQGKVMYEVLKLLEAKSSSGITASGEVKAGEGPHRLFISNHRDIVLDAAFLGLTMLRYGVPAMEVCLGDNLLIYDWIEKLVRINKGIIVHRNQRMTKALESAKQLSAYIHHAILDKNQSVWLAQREGRAKDSNDITQESLIKMLALEGPGECVAERLACLNITPVSISYEYDPNDYLKATEFLARRRDPEFKKSKADDLLSMQTGIKGFKGRIHYAFARDLHAEIAALTCEADKLTVVRRVCELIDREIHLGYLIYPTNYIAYDELNATERFATEYTQEQQTDFDAYLGRQIDRVTLPDITPEERQFLRISILTMYANPLANKLKAMEK